MTQTRSNRALKRGTLLALAMSALVGLFAASAASANDGRRATVRSTSGRAPVARRSDHRGYRGNRGGRHTAYRGYYYRPSFYSAWYWPGYYWPGYTYGPYGVYDGPYGGYYGSYFHPDAGALDLDIRPEDASIYLDGELIGVADNYDGWPRYLWLREGTYHLVIYMDGFETLAKEVRIRPGEIIALKDRMQPGASKPPEELFAQVDRKVDERRTRRSPRTAPERPEWRDRRPPREAPAVPERQWRERAPKPPIAADQRSRPARLRFTVEPSDAVVYLDGRLLGSGEELERLHSDLLVDPGSHRIDVTRPGYQSYALDVNVEAGESRDVTAELTPDR